MNDVIDSLRRASFPRKVEFLDHRAHVLETYIVGDYAPGTAIIPPSAKVACIGSCFAQEMAKSLSDQGRTTAHIPLSERWNTSFAVHHFVAAVLDGTPLPAGFLPHGVDVGEFVKRSGELKEADAFIVTFGLSLCWFELATNRMVLDVRAGHSLKGLANVVTTHTMRQTTVSENVAEIRAVIDCIRRHRPLAPIILTLSPVPLLLAMSDCPVLPANQISKAVLRAALHEVIEQRFANTYYWPSYDIVEWLAKYHGPVFGQDGNDLRHLNPSVINEIMRLFSKFYFSAA